MSLFARWAWIFGIFTGLLIVVLASSLDPATRETFSRGGIALAGAIAGVSCGFRAVRSTGRRRRAWTLLAIGGAVGLLGNLYAGLVGVPTAGDVAYVCALLLGIAGLASFPTIRPRGAVLVRMLLDSVVVGGSVLYIALFALFLQIDQSGGGTTATSLVLPVVDAALATLAVLVITRSSAAERVPLVLVGSGFVLYAVGDVSFALLNAKGTFAFGSPLDVAWVGGYLAIALAAFHPAASGSPVLDHRADSSDVAGTVVTFGLFLSAALVRVSQTGTGTSTVPATILWICVLIAVATRQILLVIDNRALRNDLERRVHERTAQLRALARERERTLEAVADGIYGVDAEGRITFMNDAGARTLDYRPSDVVGKVAHDLLHAPDVDGTSFPIVGCYITEAVRDGVTSTAEQDTYLRSDGRSVPVEVTASPLRGEGTIPGAVVVFRDMTQRREVERIKDEFVSVVSHELRTPLTSVRGVLGLLAGGALGSLPREADRMVRIALASSERLGRLIDDILDIERMDAGTSALDHADHDVEVIVGEAVDQMRVLAGRAGITIVANPLEGRVRADADRIVQTLVNLLGNAVKFSPPGTTIRVSAQESGELVEFRVQDHGRGIPPDKLETVFGRFEQVDASDAREREGTGLGLAISRSIVERHGGRIWAESDGDGTGSTFLFTLPKGYSPPQRHRDTDQPHDRDDPRLRRRPVRGAGAHLLPGGGRLHGRRPDRRRRRGQDGDRAPRRRRGARPGDARDQRRPGALGPPGGTGHRARAGRRRLGDPRRGGRGHGRPRRTLAPQAVRRRGAHLRGHRRDRRRGREAGDRTARFSGAERAPPADLISSACPAQPAHLPAHPLSGSCLAALVRWSRLPTKGSTAARAVPSSRTRCCGAHAQPTSPGG